MPGRSLFTGPGKVDGTAHAIRERHLARHENNYMIDVVGIGDVADEIGFTDLDEIRLDLTSHSTRLFYSSNNQHKSNQSNQLISRTIDLLIISVAAL